MVWVALQAPLVQLQGRATLSMFGHRRGARTQQMGDAACNPKGEWGLRPISALVVVVDGRTSTSSSRLDPASQARFSQPAPLLGQAPSVESPSRGGGTLDAGFYDRSKSLSRSAHRDALDVVVVLDPRFNGIPGSTVSSLYLYRLVSSVVPAPAMGFGVMRVKGPSSSSPR